MTDIAVIDLDFVKYGAASFGQETWIEVTHKKSGRKKEFPGRQQFWGRRGSGGWFKKTNDERVEKGLELMAIDDFSIEDKAQLSEPIENVLHSSKTMVESAIKKSGATSYEAYYGSGDPFRVELSTLWKYKGNRENLLKPLLLNDVTQYLAHKFQGQLITGIETDDKVVMECWGKPNKFILGVDKDYYGSGARFFNVNRPEDGIIDTNCLGKLWRDDKGKVRGYGRMFKLFQVCSQDSIDHYKANCFSDRKWGEVKAYTALSDSKNDKELFENAVQVFKTLYPEPKAIKGWRGDDIEIDWLYVFQEMMDMAHLQRWENDRIAVKDVLDKLGVEY